MDTVVSEVVVTPPPKWLSVGFQQYTTSPQFDQSTLNSTESATLQFVQQVLQNFQYLDTTSAPGDSIDPLEPYAIVTLSAVANRMANQFYVAKYWMNIDPNKVITGPESNLTAQEVYYGLTHTSVVFTNANITGGAITETFNASNPSAVSWKISINPYDTNIVTARSAYGNALDGMDYVISHELGHANLAARQYYMDNFTDPNISTLMEKFAQVYADGISSNFPTDRGISVPFGSPPDISARGTDGNDILQGTTGVAFIWTGAGTDTVTYASAGGGVTADMSFYPTFNGLNVYSNVENITGSSYADTIVGTDVANVLQGGPGNDLVKGAGGDDYPLQGNAGDDIIQGNAGNDAAYGGQGNDWVYGGQGNDLIFGDVGSDTVSGDIGNDTLYGGLNNDLFVVDQNTGVDTVQDFNRSEGDQVKVMSGSYSVYQSGSDTMVDFGNGSAFVLKNVAMSSLTGGWII